MKLWMVWLKWKLLKVKARKKHLPRKKKLKVFIINSWCALPFFVSTICLFYFWISEKGVPDFWLTAMKTNEVLGEEVSKCLTFSAFAFACACACASFIWWLLVVSFPIENFGNFIQIQERDEAALKYLKDIKWYRIDNPKGFKLEFFFDTNLFFKNSVLSKTYHMIDDDEPILEKAIGWVCPPR